MSLSNRWLVRNALAFVALAAMQWQCAEAANPFRFLRELFETTAKHAGDAATHIDDIPLEARVGSGVARGAERAVRSASRPHRDESRERESAFGFQEWCGVMGAICLLAAAYLMFAPKIQSRRK